MKYVSDMQTIHMNILKAPTKDIYTSTNKKKVSNTTVLPDALISDALVSILDALILHESISNARDVRSIAT